MTTLEFDKIIWRDALTFVDFFATWCGPCKMMHPVVDMFQKEMNGRADVYKVDIDDRNMLDVALSIPQKYRSGKESTKIALRGAAMKQLPESVAHRKKLGFPVPLNDWLREDKYYNMVKEKFTGPVAEKFFNVDEIMRLLDDHKAGKATNMTKIWSFYSFILWYELYFVNTQAPAGIY